MEPLFSNTCIYDQKNHLQMNNRTSIRQWLFLVYLGVALVSVILGIIWEERDLWYLGVFLLVLDIFLLFLPRLAIRGRVRQLEQLYGRSPEMYIEFFDDHMVIHNQPSPWLR